MTPAEAAAWGAVFGNAFERLSTRPPASHPRLDDSVTTAAQIAGEAILRLRRIEPILVARLEEMRAIDSRDLDDAVSKCEEILELYRGAVDVEPVAPTE